jgi:hypothetical protein
MRLIYTLGGDFPDIADLWSKEVEIQTELGLFVVSGHAICVVHALTSQVLQQSGNEDTLQQSGNEDTHFRFFGTPECEKKGIDVLRGLGAWTGSPQSTLAEDPVWKDLHIETMRLLGWGVIRSLQHHGDLLPTFDFQQYNLKFAQVLRQLLCEEFLKWNASYVCRHEGPLANAGRDPPLLFVTAIRNHIKDETSLMNNEEEISRAVSRGFWDVACMAIHPDHFDYPAEMGGRGVRKTTSTTIAPSQRPTFEESLPLLVAAFCSLDRWLGRFTETKLPTLKKCFTVTVHPPEKENVQSLLCPRHFSLDQETMVPSDELLQHATNGDDRYFTSLFKLMAVRVPCTTVRVLEGVKEFGDKIGKTTVKALRKVEKNPNTSTTKKQKEQCAGCGTNKRNSEEADEVFPL